MVRKVFQVSVADDHQKTIVVGVVEIRSGWVDTWSTKILFSEIGVCSVGSFDSVMLKKVAEIGGLVLFKVDHQPIYIGKEQLIITEVFGRRGQKS